MAIGIEGGGSFKGLTVIDQKAEYGGLLGDVYSAVKLVHKSSLFAP